MSNKQLLTELEQIEKLMGLLIFHVKFLLLGFMKGSRIDDSFCHLPILNIEASK